MSSTPTATTTPPGGRTPQTRARPPQAPPARLRAWVTRAPLLPALVFLIIVTQLPMVATLVISVIRLERAVPGGPQLRRARQLRRGAQRSGTAQVGASPRSC